MSSVFVRSPADGAVFSVQNDSLISISLNYDLPSTLITERAAYCFYITKLDEKKQYSENCFHLSTRDISINEISVGEYALTSYLRELEVETQQAQAIIVGSGQVNRFKINKYSALIPFLDVKSDICNAAGSTRGIAFPVNPQTQTAVAELSFTLLERHLPVSSFSICISLSFIDGAVVLRETCLSPGQLTAQLNNLGIGKYTLQAGLKESAADGGTIPSTIIKSAIEIYDLKRAVTDFRIVEHSGLVREGSASDVRMEYAVDAHSQRADTPFTIALRTSPCSAESLISVCLELRAAEESTGAATQILPRTCLSANARTITPQRLPPGTYTAIIFLQDARQTQVDSEASIHLPAHQSLAADHTVRVLIETRHAQELEPSYDWQRLHAWHTIPAGMDVR